MIFGNFNRIIFRDFREEAARLILSEIKKQNPADEYQLGAMIAGLGAEVLVTVDGSTCLLVNITGCLWQPASATGTGCELVEAEK